MDPSLLRERERFKKRALAVPTVEKRKAKDKDVEKSKPPKKQKFVEKSKKADFDYRKATGSSQFKFGVLAKIVKHMKSKHQDGDVHPLTLEEILDETNQMDIGPRMRHWLATESLNNNPKIEVLKGEGSEEDQYKFKPKYGFKDKKTFLRFLDKQDQTGMGGILLEDVEEALPRCAKVLKNLGDQITSVDRPIDKKKVLFYNDKSHNFTVDEELQKLWRGCTVEGVDERKIEDYLEKHGIASMQDVDRKMPVQKRKKGGKKKNRQFKSHNDHLAGVLQDYSGVQK